MVGLRFALWVLLGALAAAASVALEGYLFRDAAFITFVLYQVILLALLTIVSGLALGYFAFFATRPGWRLARWSLFALTLIVPAVASRIVFAAEWLTGIGGSPVLQGVLALFALCLADMAVSLARPARGAT